jgi:hypothetical protein
VVDKAPAILVAVGNRVVANACVAVDSILHRVVATSSLPTVEEHWSHSGIRDTRSVALDVVVVVVVVGKLDSGIGVVVAGDM